MRSTGRQDPATPFSSEPRLRPEWYAAELEGKHSPGPCTEQGPPSCVAELHKIFGMAHASCLGHEKSRLSGSKTSQNTHFCKMFLRVELCERDTSSWREGTPREGQHGALRCPRRGDDVRVHPGEPCRSHEVELRLQRRGHLVRLRAAPLLVLAAGLPAGLAGRVLVVQLPLVAPGPPGLRCTPLAG